MTLAKKKAKGPTQAVPTAQKVERHLSIASGVQRGPQAWLLPESPVVGPWEEGGATMGVGILMESQW